jgi:hypothetical protein
MKYLKKFNEVVEENSIEYWCKEFSISNYEIVDGFVNVKGSVNIDDIYPIIPIKFGVVDGDFEWVDTEISTLENVPKKVGGKFNCSFNGRLKSLIGCPIEVGGEFNCSHNSLISLEGCPDKIYDSFDCSGNGLESLRGGPKIVGEDFKCNENELTDLKGSPVEVGGDFYCLDNQIISLNNISSKIFGDVYCRYNPIYDIFKLFGSYKKYKYSLEHEYLDGTNIIRFKFKEACEEVDIEMPDSIPGYKYI